MKKLLTNIVNKDIKSIATFCMITFITAVFLFSPQVDTTIRISGIGMYLLYAFGFLFGKVKTLLIHSFAFVFLLIIGALLTTYTWHTYKLDMAAIFMPSILASYFGSWFIILTTDVKKLKFTLSLLPGLFFFLGSALIVLFLKTNNPIIYISVEILILFIEWAIILMFSKKDKKEEIKENVKDRLKED